MQEQESPGLLAACRLRLQESTTLLSGLRHVGYGVPRDLVTRVRFNSSREVPIVRCQHWLGLRVSECQPQATFVSSFTVTLISGILVFWLSCVLSLWLMVISLARASGSFEDLSGFFYHNYSWNEGVDPPSSKREPSNPVTRSKTGSVNFIHCSHKSSYQLSKLTKSFQHL